MNSTTLLTHTIHVGESLVTIDEDWRVTIAVGTRTVRGRWTDAGLEARMPRAAREAIDSALGATIIPWTARYEPSMTQPGRWVATTLDLSREGWYDDCGRCGGDVDCVDAARAAAEAEQEAEMAAERRNA